MLQTLKAAFRDQYATRHFIIVAASSPTDDHNNILFDPNALQPIATALLQVSVLSGARRGL